jgi:hypothetical protein
MQLKQNFNKQRIHPSRQDPFKRMLDGTYEPPEEVDEHTNKLINQFRKNRKATEHDPLYKIT